MANIFKKIKSIEEVSDALTPPPEVEKTSSSHKPLGLKPVHVDTMDSDLSTFDFEDKASDKDDNDLQIPDVEDVDSNSLINDNMGETDNFEDKLDKTADHEDSAAEDNKGLNIRPADLDPQPKKPIESIIKPIIEDEPSQISATPQTPTIADKLPTILSDTPVTPLKPPSFSAPKWPYWLLAFIGFMWVLGSAAAAYGYFELGLNSLSANPIHAFGFVGFILVPACLLLMTALMLKRMNQLSFESQKMAFINEQLLTPSDYSAKAADNLSKSITGQIDNIELRAEQAIHRIQQLQSALDQQISSVTDTLSQNAEQQGTLDSQLLTSKAAWTQTVKDTDQTITELSQSLDTVLQSFEARVKTSQQQFDLVKSSMLEYSENIDTALSAQDAKVKTLTEHHEKITLSSNELRDKWQSDDDSFQDRIFNQLSQLDAVSEQADALVKKLERSTEAIKTSATSPQDLPLRGTMQEEQLNLLPGLGDAKAMLPTLLEAEVEEGIPSPLNLDFDDIDTLDMEEILRSSPNAPQLPLASQRIGSEPETTQKKKKWFKSFGKREENSSPVDKTHSDNNLAIPSIPTQIGSIPPQNSSYTPLTLTERLIREQLSPDVLIDSGCAREAARLRLHEGPFAMSRYVSTHLGAAVVHLRDLLPNNPALRTQVNDMAAVFPIREKLDTRDEEALAYIFSSQAGREFLLCEAAVNGSF